jgi:hypothetical protein
MDGGREGERGIGERDGEGSAATRRHLSSTKENK